MYYFMALINFSACALIIYDLCVFPYVCHMSANTMDQDKCYKTKQSHNNIIVVIYPALYLTIL